jgi:hypothetical protein
MRVRHCLRDSIAPILSAITTVEWTEVAVFSAENSNFWPPNCGEIVGIHMKWMDVSVVWREA